MSEQDSKLSSRAEDFLALFNKGAEFTRELLKENERLRGRLAAVTDRQESAARNPGDWNKLRHELMTRIATLEEECTTVRERLRSGQLHESHVGPRSME